MKLRRFELKKVGDVHYRDLLDAVMSGGSTSDDVLRSVMIGAKAEEDIGEVWLSSEEHAWLLERLNKTTWNAHLTNRKTIAEFVSYLRNLQEESVDVMPKKERAA